MRLLFLQIVLLGFIYFLLGERVNMGRGSVAIDTVESVTVPKFKMPILKVGKQDNFPKTFFTANNISRVFPRVMGKFKFADTVSVFEDKVEKGWRMSIPRDSMPDFNGFELKVDYAHEIYLPQYNQDTLYAYYPVYFINSTQTNKVFFGKDSYTFGIQEALQGYSDWLPIERKGFDFCGNGHWQMIVEPGEFILVLMRKYKGSETTYLRVKFRMGASTYVSEGFKGQISPEQKYLKDDYALESLMKSRGKAARYMFYGGGSWLNIPDVREKVRISIK
jgi:hypothetical protein